MIETEITETVPALNRFAKVNNSTYQKQIRALKVSNSPAKKY